MNKFLVVTTLVVMVMGTGLKGCDKTAGSDQGDSAGNNQPNALPGCAIPAGGGGEPAAQLDDGKYVYDFYVELWDEDCHSAAMVGDSDPFDDETGPAPIPPIKLYINGSITDKNRVEQPAYFLDSAKTEKDINTPYHLRGFVSPRNAPHKIILIARVNPQAREWVGESLDGGALHCRITRDSKPIHDAPNKNGTVVDRTTHTVALVNGAASVSCHLAVGVG